MAVQTKNWVCTKDKTIDITHQTGQGVSDYLLVGLSGGNKHRVLLDFTRNWDGVGQIVRAELVFKSTGEHNFDFGTAPEVRAGRFTAVSSWSEGNADDGSWHADDYTKPGTSSPTASQKLTTAKNFTCAIDITAFVDFTAPASVLMSNGNPGRGGHWYGVQVWTPDETKTTQRIEFYSRHHATSGNRPYIRLTYDVGKAAPNAPTLGDPSGDVEPGGFFTGDFTSQQASDALDQVEVRLWDSTGTSLVWSQTSSVSEAQRLSATFAVPFPESVKSLTDYKWDARVADQGGTWSAYATKKTFRVTNTAPVVVAITKPTVDTLKNFLFEATYSDADGDLLRSFRMQFRTQTSEGNPAWGDSLLWDSGVLAPKVPGQISIEYGGRSLAAGTYSFRIMATDARGGMSAWDYADIVLSANYESEGLAYDNMTGYARLSKYRIVLREVDTANARGPKDPPVGIITDAANIGAATYANSPGEFFFTLPIDHPQIGVCEPYRTHYAVEQYVGDRWVEKFTGLLDDFDSTDNEVVFHGIDYLGLLSLSVDERYDSKNAEKSYTDGGSKYNNVAISSIIADLIDTGKAQTDSTYGFIARGASPTYWDAFAERVILTTTYNQHLSTIAGLIDSHKQGASDRRSRLWVEKTIGGTYRFRLADNTGKDRENIRLEYGGLLNGFRLVAFGDFGTIAHGIGRIKDQLKPYYQKAESPVNDGIHTATGVWGRVSKAAVWQDLQDENDLKRRVKEMAVKAGKIGKRVALAITVGTLDPFDGYDIHDSVRVVVQRGAVDTSKFGSGLWTIYGVAWRLFPDGHTDLTLTVLPKIDDVPVDPDLLDPIEILPEEDWRIEFRPPQPEDTGVRWYDALTGITYYWDQDLQGWYILDRNGNPILETTDPDDPFKKIRIYEGRIWVSTDGGASWSSTMTADGHDATYITSGNLPGGSNLIPDGSFELAPFPTSAPSLLTWDSDGAAAPTGTGGWGHATVTLVALSISGSGTAAVIQLTNAT